MKLGPWERMGPSNTILRAGSTPSRSLEAKEKCIATLMFVGKDYPPPPHPPPQTAAREDAGSFCTAPRLQTPPPPAPAPVVYSSNDPINAS